MIGPATGVNILLATMQWTRKWTGEGKSCINGLGKSRYRGIHPRHQLMFFSRTYLEYMKTSISVHCTRRSFCVYSSVNIQVQLRSPPVQHNSTQKGACLPLVIPDSDVNNV
jgi:hypothetical protein